MFSRSATAGMKSLPMASALHYILSTLLHFLRLLLCPALPKPALPSPPPPPKPHSLLPDLFRAFDRDGDGRITANELENTLADLGIYMTPRDLAALIADFDADGDGCVDEEEFEDLYKRLSSGGKSEGGGEAEEEMRDAFDVFDEDGDGYITAEELTKVMRALGMEQGSLVEECRRMIGCVDVDGDGRVDFEEFKVMMGRDLEILMKKRSLH